MAELYITEFSVLPKDLFGEYVPAPMVPPIAEQKITYTSAAASAAFNAETHYVRLLAEGDDAHVRFGTGTVTAATAAQMKLVQDQEGFYGVNPGDGLSVYDGTT